MDAETIKKHWDLVKMGALHGYIPDGSHPTVNALAVAYGQRVDTNCGNCIMDMMLRLYNNFKSEFGE